MSSERQSRLRRTLGRKAVVLAAATALVAGAATLAVPSLYGPNFHAVIPGRIYRSGQLSASEFETIVRLHHIRSVINLRGAKPGRVWYDAELAAAKRHNVVRRDLDFSSKRLPPRPTLMHLIQAIEELPEPLLLHCSAGADRAGVASVVARLVRGNTPLREARSELSLVYGHLPFGPATEIARVFDLYEDHMRRSGEPDAAATFRRWAARAYVPYEYAARIQPVAFPAAAVAGEPMRARFRATNVSPAAWHFTSVVDAGIKLGIRIGREAGDWRDFDRAGHIDRVVQPGQSIEFDFAMTAPRQAGTYALKFDMVDEHVTWFEDQGSTSLELPLQVVRR